MLSPDPASQVEELTRQLETAQLDSSLLVRRAGVFEQLGQFDRAFADLRAALTYDRANPDAKTGLERVLRAVQDQQSQLTDSLPDLARLAAGEERAMAAAAGAAATPGAAPTAAGTETANVRRLEAARRLASLTCEPRACMHIVGENQVEMLVDAVLAEPEPTRPERPSLADASLRLVLLRTINNIASVPEAAQAVAQCFLRGNGGGLDAFVGKSEPMSVRVACDCLAAAVVHATSAALDPDARLPIARAAIILRVLASHCHPSFADHVQKAALAALIKAAATQDLVLAIFMLPDFALVLQHVCNADESFRMLVAALLARCFEHIEPANEPAVLQAFSKTISMCLQSKTTADVACGLLSVAAIFDARPQFGTALLGREGIMDAIVRHLEHGSSQTQLNAVKALSSACNDPDSRKTVAARCVAFLLRNYDRAGQPEFRAAASLTLIKLTLVDKTVEQALLGNDATVRFFLDALQADSRLDMRSKLAAVEALAYLSVNSRVKEKIVKSKELLKLLHSLCTADDNRSTQYGVAIILSNVTAYRRRLTAEEEQVRKLQQLASQGKPDASPAADDELEKDPAVAKRTKLVVASGALATLSHLAKSDSTNIRDTVAKSYLSIATDASLRGNMIQMGACRALAGLATKGSADGRAAASQALAKIAITSDPNLAFKGQLMFELVRPLVALCGGDDQLRQFEALMALTNIASVGDDVRAHIVKMEGLKAMEQLQFSDNTMVRRAATEALCNMMFLDEVLELYATGQGSRLKMMVALSDSEDFATRRAASGALAVLSSSGSTGAAAVAAQPRAAEILVDLVQDESPELQHRGAETIKNVAAASASAARQIVEAGGVPTLAILAKGSEPTVAQTCVEALRALIAAAQGR
ncbi:SWI5-dependent HO expression protein 4 [Polyrhizophydium stewartii]|uniref:Protein unc-45 homolog B n=1 Tax=Polyrhizophydium stewartii TaxID=2732419 RepID=A0ABR4N9H7_9FUNG